MYPFRSFIISLFLGVLSINESFSNHNVFEPPITTSSILGNVSYSISKNNSWNGFPVIDIDGLNSLNINFDLLETKHRDLIYTFERYEANWSKSNLSDSKFINVFNEFEVDAPKSSMATLVDYSNYSISLSAKNRNFTINKSGNYILKVYDKYDRSKAIFSFPFAIIDKKVNVSTKDINANNGKIFEYQSLSISVEHKGYDIYQPKDNIKVQVIQNGRWDNSVCLTEPSSISIDKIVFDNTKAATFEASNNFYKFESITNNIAGLGVDKIYDSSSPNLLELFAVRNSVGESYITDENQFGRSIIRLAEFDNLDEKINADYNEVLFTFKSPFIKNQRIFLSGEAFRFLEEADKEMEYNHEIYAYTKSVLMKMGYHEYKILSKKDGENKLISKYTIGNHIENRNNYTILIYQHTIEDNIDILIGIDTFIYK